MKKVVIFSVLLISGLVLSQFLPTLVGNAYGPLEHVIRMLTMMALAFIMSNDGIGGPILTAAMLSLCLNLVLTGVFIMIAKWLLQSSTVDTPGEPLAAGRQAHD